MATYSWPPVPADSGVLYYQIDRETPQGYQAVAQIPNVQNDDAFFNFGTQRFFYKDNNIGTLRLAAVSDVGMGPYSYLYPPAPLPPPPIPSLDLQGPSSPYSFRTQAPAMMRTSRRSKNPAASKDPPTWWPAIGISAFFVGLALVWDAKRGKRR
jgi:hypothetical protein